MKPPGPKQVQPPAGNQTTRPGFGTAREPQTEARQTILLGRFRLAGERIEKGKSVVYRAQDNETGQEVAIKEIDLGIVRDFKIFECFEREAPTLKGLDHPGVVKCVHFERVEAEGSVKQYLVTEWVDGKTLTQFRKDEGRLTRAQISSIMEQLAGILEYLHSLNPPLIHRDIKPENIMIRIKDGKPIVTLVDFGFALSDKSTGTTVYAINSLGFTAPEIAEGKEAKPKSDIYSLGSTYLWLRSGKTASDVKDEDDPTKYCAQLPEELSRSEKRLLRKVLHPNQKKRYASANELFSAVKKAEAQLHRRELLKAYAQPAWTMSPERAKQILDSEVGQFLSPWRRKALVERVEKPVSDLENEIWVAKSNMSLVNDLKKKLEVALNVAIYGPKAALGMTLAVIGFPIFILSQIIDDYREFISSLAPWLGITGFFAGVGFLGKPTDWLTRLIRNSVKSW